MFFLSVFSLIIALPAAAQPSFDELTWLEGSWHAQGQANWSMMWSGPDAGLIGMAHQNDQGALTAFMQIVQGPDGMALNWRRLDPHISRGSEERARPARRASYGLIDHDAGKVVFENERIDSYQTVALERTDEQTLVLRLTSDESYGTQLDEHIEFKRLPAEHPNITAAKELRKLIKAKEYETAKQMVTNNPRRWFNELEGEGRAWQIGPGKKGPWADWDKHFRGRTNPIYWEADEHSATIVYRETNDYFQLLERGEVTTRTTYLFDENGLVKGLLIRSLGKRPPGRTEDFLEWAKANEPDEIAELMPDGSVDPEGDHPQRVRAILNRWRKAAGLDPIE